MHRLLFTLLILLSSLSIHADRPRRQAHPSGRYSLYRVELRDKQGTTGNLSKPETFLSERALKRRQQQQLVVDSTDLPLSPHYLAALAKEGWEVVGGSRWLNTVIVKVKRDADVEPLKQLPFVRKTTRIYAAPDSIMPDGSSPVLSAPHPTPSNASVYGQGRRQIAMLNGEKLHEAGFSGKGVMVAVVDGGFMNVDKISWLKDVDIVGTRDMVYPYKDNLYGLLDHGTMVLSCMATRADGIFVGTAPDASYLLLRSEHGPTEQLAEEDWWVQAVEYADSMGADVVNSSLGYNIFDLPEQNHVYREQDGHTAFISRAASLMASKGMVLVSSAGNEGRKPWKRIKFPADAHDVLAVAAIGRDSVNTEFSSVGPSADWRVKPDVSSLGKDATVIDGTGEVTTANGTSFASPILCGMVACLRQAFPNMPAKQLMQLVRLSSNRHDYPDNIFGYGVPDFWKAYQLGLKE